MGSERDGPVSVDDELSSLRREVVTLRQRVAELQRRLGGYRSGEAARPIGEVEATVSMREELLVEAERIGRIGSWMWDLENDTVFWSDQLFRILGYDADRDQASTDAFFARVHPEDRDRVQQASLRSVETGAAEQIDFRVLLPDGRLRYVTMNGAMLFDEAEQLRRVVGTVRDLTDERLLEQRMQRSLELLEEAQAIAQMGHWAFDLKSQKVDWSTGLYRVLGVDASTAPSREHFFSMLLPEDRERFEEVYEAVMRGELREEMEGRFVRGDGEIRTARIKAVALRNAAGDIIAYRGTLIDITEQARLAERVAQMGKTEVVARLAGGIAHDFNNLLTVIGANLELWAEQHGEDPEIVDARQAVQSARMLTDRLLALGRRSHLVRRVLNPNEIVSRTAEMLRRVVGEPVSIGFHLAEALPAVDVDATLIEQVLINLVLNARDALLPRGGTIQLSTRGVQDGRGQGWVEIEVADDGAGMSPAVLRRVFEPFFTTKGERGTGLGLPTVLGTVEQHGGSVDVDSEPGVGTRFRVRLPAVARAMASAELAPEVARDGVPQGRGVLVIEDDPLVLGVISRTLERRGLSPLLASSPDEALRLWELRPELELVIYDLGMAGMRGPELVEQLQQSGRSVRVLYVTGDYDEQAARGALAAAPLLTKPFKPADLMRALSTL